MGDDPVGCATYTHVMEDFSDTPITRQKSPVPRARLFLRARLGWLWGYPCLRENGRVDWQQLHYPLPWDTAAFTLTHDHLAQASVARNRLVHDFPRALPAVIADIDGWTQRVVLKLQALRSLLDGKPVDPVNALLAGVKNGERLQRRLQAFQRRFPDLQILTEMCVWWLSLEPDTLSAALTWLEEEHHAHTRLLTLDLDHRRACATLFTLAQQQTPQAASHLLRLAVHPLWTMPDPTARQYWLDRLKTMRREWRYDLPRTLEQLRQIEQLPPDHLTPGKMSEQPLNNPDWFIWAETLLLKPRRERKQYLDLLKTLLPMELLDNWQTHRLQLQHAFKQIDKTLHEYRTQQAVLTDQSLSLMQESGELYEQLRALPHTRPSTTNRQWMRLAAQRNALNHQLAQLKELEDYLAKDMGKQLDDYLLAIDADNTADFAALSYVPRQSSLPTLLTFALEHQVWLYRLHTLLSSLPVQHAWQTPDGLLRWLGYWRRYQRWDSYNTVKLPAMLEKLCSHLEQARDAERLSARLAPWSYLLERPLRSDVYADYEAKDDAFSLGTSSREPEEFEVFLPLLGELCEQHPMDATAANAFRRCWQQAPGHWPLVDFYAALLEQAIQLADLTESEYQALDLLLAGQYTPARFRELIIAWDVSTNENTPQDKPESNTRAALPAAAYLTAAGCGEVVEHFAGQRQWQPLAQLKPVLDTFLQQGLPVPEPPLPEPAPVDWPYPLALSTALAFLQRYHPAAQPAAQRILSGHFPTCEALQHELAVLTQKIAAADQPPARQQALSKRLHNLRQRLDQPAPLNDQQAVKLSAKLRHAACVALLDAWRAHCQQAMQAHVCERLDLPTLPTDWMQDKRHWRSLTALCTLGEPERKLASLLLRARLTGADQDLRSLPRNREWLENMQQAGIAMQPWLEAVPFPVSVQTETPAGSATVTLQLQFADDFFDILQMGDHFETCLSHDEFNFFSVVANAADLNKRVLYAHDAAGRVQGRCLLGISAERQLLSFHPYSHTQGDAFEQALNLFLIHLENSMGIQRSDAGRIPLLVASDWYDDGVTTPMPAYAALELGSPFRQQLKSTPPDAILAVFEQTIAPLPLTEPGLKQLLELEEIITCADCLFGVWEQAQRRQLDTPSVRNTLLNYVLMLETVPHERLWPWVKDWLFEHLLAKLTNDGDCPPAQMALLHSQEPASVLRLARQLMPCMKKDWSYYWSDLHVYQARALLSLQRPRKAEAEYRLAIERYDNSPYGMNLWNPQQVRAEMEERLAVFGIDLD